MTYQRFPLIVYGTMTFCRLVPDFNQPHSWVSSICWRNEVCSFTDILRYDTGQNQRSNSFRVHRRDGKNWSSHSRYFFSLWEDSGPCISSDPVSPSSALRGSKRAMNITRQSNNWPEKLQSWDLLLWLAADKASWKQPTVGQRTWAGDPWAAILYCPWSSNLMPNLDKWVNIRYFFIRKTLLIKYSFAFVVAPGGFGTLDEFFEAVTLTQTRKIQQFPIIIFNRTYHRELWTHRVDACDQDNLRGGLRPYSSDRFDWRGCSIYKRTKHCAIWAHTCQKTFAVAFVVRTRMVLTDYQMSRSATPS